MLIALGTWQLAAQGLEGRPDRRARQRGSRRRRADLPPRERWPRARRRDGRIPPRRRSRREFVPSEEALVYTGGSALRAGRHAARLLGVRAGAARRTAASSWSIAASCRKAGRIRARARAAAAGVVEIIGVLRWPEARGLVHAGRRRRRSDLWFVRDPPRWRRRKGWGAVAPFYIDQEAPARAGRPAARPGRCRSNLPNNHLQYALTWFGLALALVAVFAFWAARGAAAASSGS